MLHHCLFRVSVDSFRFKGGKALHRRGKQKKKWRKNIFCVIMD